MSTISRFTAKRACAMHFGSDSASQKKIFKLASAPKPIISDVVHWWGAASWLWPPCGQLVGEAPPQKSGEKWCLGGDGISCSAPAPKGTRGRWCLTPFGTAQESKTRKAPHPPKTKDQTKGLGEKRGKKEKTKKRKEGGREKKRKTTAPRIPAWSPTVVLTGRHSG